jgi:hypothetical protein
MNGFGIADSLFCFLLIVQLLDLCPDSDHLSKGSTSASVLEKVLVLVLLFGGDRRADDDDDDDDDESVETGHSSLDRRQQKTSRAGRGVSPSDRRMRVVYE